MGRGGARGDDEMEGAGGRGEEEARTLYVGGLAGSADADVLAAVFGAFGELAAVEVAASGAHAFVCFEEEEDARAAQANMHHAELYGRTLTVAPAQRAARAAAAGPVDRPLWETPEYFAAREAEQRAQAAAAGPRPRGVQSEGDGFRTVHGDGSSDSGSDDDDDDSDDGEGDEGSGGTAFFVPADLAKDQAEGRRA